ncbi:hypothetical protein M2272_005851 [Mycobacterium frederiksbergense]|uniref:Tail assembly chaperone n=1 Tax=Mycolicibacterium frederiksbergense TaxID=117567 RepID=A0ABT6L898_9MYCO|nr:hypothetical protein [Mycolicibacterium frederiksbergense]MDH6199183.1 hypothetical protein [Mycolicibacterium frederiksbergense]
MSDIDKSNHPINPKVARDQATEYLGFMGSILYDLGDDETFELPNPQLMDPDMKARYLEHIRSMAEDLDTVKQKNPITGEERDVPKYPPRIDGKLINDEELLCIALMGEDTYKKFLKAGGVPGQINTAWQMMERQLRERLKQDSKST